MQYLLYWVLYKALVCMNVSMEPVYQKSHDFQSVLFSSCWPLWESSHYHHLPLSTCTRGSLLFYVEKYSAGNNEDKKDEVDESKITVSVVLPFVVQFVGSFSI